MDGGGGLGMKERLTGLGGSCWHDGERCCVLSQGSTRGRSSSLSVSMLMSVSKAASVNEVERGGGCQAHLDFSFWSLFWLLCVCDSCSVNTFFFFLFFCFFFVFSSSASFFPFSFPTQRKAPQQFNERKASFCPENNTKTPKKTKANKTKKAAVKVEFEFPATKHCPQRKPQQKPDTENHRPNCVSQKGKSQQYQKKKERKKEKKKQQPTKRQKKSSEEKTRGSLCFLLPFFWVVLFESQPHNKQRDDARKRRVDVAWDADEPEA